MEMGIARHCIPINDGISAGYTSGAASDGAGRLERLVDADHSRIMKLVTVKHRTDQEKRIGRVDLKFAIAMALWCVTHLHVERKDICHCVTLSSPEEASGKQHETTAFGEDGKSGFRRLEERCKETRILCQLFSMGFRKSTANVEGVQALRQRCLLYCRNWHEFRAGALKLLKVFRIIEAECGILQIADLQAVCVWKPRLLRRRHLDRRRIVGHREQCIQIKIVVHHFEQILFDPTHSTVFQWRNEAEMAFGKWIGGNSG